MSLLTWKYSKCPKCTRRGFLTSCIIGAKYCGQHLGKLDPCPSRVICTCTPGFAWTPKAVLILCSARRSSVARTSFYANNEYCIIVTVKDSNVAWIKRHPTVELFDSAPTRLFLVHSHPEKRTIRG